MSFFKSPQDWANLAVSLGLSPREAQAGFGEAASFGQLCRSIGAHAAAPPSFSHWLTGMWRGTECLVVHYSVGSGSNRRHYTSAVVKIDPPLFLGASIDRDGSVVSLFEGSDLQLGIPHIDEALRLKSLMPARLYELLAPRTGGDGEFLDKLANAVRNGLTVTDSRVMQRFSGLVVEPRFIHQGLEAAHWAAAKIGRRRARMGVLPEEFPVHAEWRRFADARKFAFDPSHMTLKGTAGGAEVHIALETSGSAIGTAVEVRWPRPLGVRLHLRKQGALAFLTNLFEQDIVTGDRAFDDAFVVQGHPEAWVRQALASPAVRDALRMAAHAASELTMNDHALSWMLARPTTTAAELDAHVEMATRTSTALFGRIEEHGPYR